MATETATQPMRRSVQARTESGGLAWWPPLVLLLGIFAVGSEALVISPLLKDIARDFTLTDAQAAWSVAVYGLAIAIAAPIIGTVSDRWPRPRQIGGGMLLFILGTLGCVIADSFWALLAARAVCGIAAGAFLPAAYAYVGDEVPYERRAAVMGRVLAGWAMAVTIGVPLGGLLGEWIGWRGALAAIGVLAVIAAPLAFLLPSSRVSALPQQRVEAGTGTAAGGALLDALRTPGVKPMLLVNLLEMTAFYGGYTFLGSFLRDSLGIGSGAAGAMIVFYGLGVLLATTNARLYDRLGKPTSLQAGLIGLALVLALVPYLGGAVVAIAGVMVVWGLSQASAMTNINTIISARSERARGAVMALISCTSYLGVTLAATALGAVFAWGGYAWVGGVASALALTALIVFRLWLRRDRRVSR